MARIPKTPDFFDDELPETMDETQIKYMVQEVRALNAEAHRYLRISPQPMNLVLAALAIILVNQSSQNNADLQFFLRDFALLVMPVLVGCIGVYQLNVASEAAALSELHDRLTYRLNHALGRPIFVSRVAGNIRKRSLGTYTFYGLGAVVVVLIIVIGWRNANADNAHWDGFLFPLQVTVTILTLLGLLITIIENYLTRPRVNRALDKVFTNRERPGTPQVIAKTRRDRKKPKARLS